MSAARLLPLALLAGCGGQERFFFDLSTRPDGVKIVVLVDKESGFRRSLPPVLIARGRRVQGPRLDLQLEEDEQPRLFELNARILEHPLGPVVFERLTIERGQPEAMTLEGQFLSILASLNGVPVFKPTDDGSGTPVDRLEAEVLQNQIRLRRVVDSEPCPPPFEPLEPLIPDARGAFEGFLDPTDNGDVAAIHAPDPETTVVLGGSLMMVLRNRTRLVPVNPPSSPPRDWLTLDDFGSSSLRAMVPLGGPDYMVVGGERREGRAWRVRLDAQGLQITETSTFPHRLKAAGKAGNQLLVLDNHGTLYGGSAPEAAWTVLSASVAEDVEDAEVAGAPNGSIARGTDSRLQVFGGPLEGSMQLESPRFRNTGIEALLWTADLRLWVSTEQGDIFVLSEEGLLRRGDAFPPRLTSCTLLEYPLDEVHVEQEIPSLLESEDFVFALLDGCSAILSLRKRDFCAGLLTDAQGPLPLRQKRTTAYVGAERLFVGGENGLLQIARKAVRNR